MIYEDINYDTVALTELSEIIESLIDTNTKDKRKKEYKENLIEINSLIKTYNKRANFNTYKKQ